MSKDKNKYIPPRREILFLTFMLGAIVGAILLHLIGTYPPCW